jgi:hypothetical protein
MLQANPCQLVLVTVLHLTQITGISRQNKIFGKVGILQNGMTGQFGFQVLEGILLRFRPLELSVFF